MEPTKQTDGDATKPGRTIQELQEDIESLQRTIERVAGLCTSMSATLQAHGEQIRALEGQNTTIAESLSTVARAVNIDPAIGTAGPDLDLQGYQ